MFPRGHFELKGERLEMGGGEVERKEGPGPGEVEMHMLHVSNKWKVHGIEKCANDKGGGMDDP
jgi:hypothetical protein